MKEQISQSVSRVKAARHGHSIDKIFKEHDTSFFLPFKESYISKRKEKLLKMNSEISDYSRHSREKSRVFQTEIPEGQYSSVHIRNRNSSRGNRAVRVKTTSRSFNKRTREISQQRRFREMKEKYSKEIQNLPTKNNTISFIVSENRNSSRLQHKSINNILDYKPTKPSIEDEEIRMVSYINSKPLQPYISLLPLKNFLKKEQEFARKGTLGSSPGNQEGNTHKRGKNLIIIAL